MAYLTGVAATADALLQTLGVFLTDNGWTFSTFTERTGTTTDTAVATGYTVYSFVDPNGAIFNIRIVDGTFELNVATGVSLGKMMRYQPGANNTLNAKVKPAVFPIASYHMFLQDNAVNIAMEVSGGVFTHMNLGSIAKLGNWQGGQYVTGTHWTGPGNYNYQFGDSDVGNFYPFGAGSSSLGRSLSTNSYGHGFITQKIGSTGFSYFGGSDNTDLAAICPQITSLGRVLLDNSPNGFNGRSVMLPAQICMTSTPDRLAPLYQLGYLPNVCFTNIADQDPAELVNTEWMVFPLHEKNGNNTTYANTGNYGIAYRK